MRYSVFFLLFFFLSGSFSLRALSLSEVDYTSEDSLQVVRWLEEAQKKYIKSERMLFFANKFLGRPYVGATLEKNQEERLVVNLNELDCTTLVENVTALALTAGRGSTSLRLWSAFVIQMESGPVMLPGITILPNGFRVIRNREWCGMYFVRDLLEKVLYWLR